MERRKLNREKASLIFSGLQMVIGIAIISFLLGAVANIDGTIVSNPKADE